MSLAALTGARVFDGADWHDDTAVLIAEGHVAGLVPAGDLPQGAARHALEGGTLAPGFVDLQVNGGAGRMIAAGMDVAALRAIAAAHARLGATTILPTLITDAPQATRAVIDTVADALARGVPGLAGLHLEGPHLDPRRHGAHDAALIRPMTGDDLALYLQAAARLPVLKITLAPEAATADQIGALARAGVIVSLGHSGCTHAQARQATDAGARLVTHLFNAMSQLGSREPGLVGAALADGRLSAGLIADLVHVHPDTIRAALAAKTAPGQVFLVSDAMAVAGTDLDDFRLGGRRILRRAGQLTLEDGTLAGADLDLAKAVRNLVQVVGVPPGPALAMATAIPGGLVGTGGRIVPGGTADLVHLDGDLRVTRVWQAGAMVSGVAQPGKDDR
ncbi:N-acetylglucosamine-6-phosphate deacetylase [Thalassococcus sp. CAU 1522]|uniref:N-acetylglucosamine-6-phosphate deacetylase n=1 Tax=Thalassococcus arenae TaxID=2851652 RepID=A0ABS6N7R0_9RHOB|nr:N-acetylglucosamine-6-phosphate deacetylase [Thalassococcus arenae]MBV2360055.1 N-acetylglucosamine-6-phosphate deacetylase [Thalassococcus arenae]